MDDHGSQPLISVIIPVYNVENYAARCFESVIKNDYGNLEIFLIDDGSTDRSGDICNAFALKDSRITVIHQPNRGLSAARNAGLERASGEYIAFIDSDDWIHEKYFSVLMKGIRSGSAAMSVCDYVRTDDEHELDHLEWTDEFSLLRSTQLLQSHKMKSFCTRRLYRKDLLSAVRFDSNVKIEDAMFNTEVIAKNPVFTAAYIPLSLYAYYERPGSLASGLRAADYLDLGKRIWELSMTAADKDMQEALAEEAMKRLLHARFGSNNAKDRAEAGRCNETMKQAVMLPKGRKRFKYRILLSCPFVYWLFRITDDPTLLQSNSKEKT